MMSVFEIIEREMKLADARPKEPVKLFVSKKTYEIMLSAGFKKETLELYQTFTELKR